MDLGNAVTRLLRMRLQPRSICFPPLCGIVPLLYVGLVMVGCGGIAPTSNVTPSQEDPISRQRAGRAAVSTRQNDNQRSGLNLGETILTPDNVRPEKFGKLASFLVQGEIYAQPLYAPNVRHDREISNLLIVATQHDQLYAFDVDSRKLIWHVDFLANGANVSALSTNDVFDCDDITPEIGITSTPVIDPSSQTVYVLVRTKETVDGQPTFFQRLHAVSLSNGGQLLPPTTVTGPPSDYGSTGSATFDPLLNNQRAALLLAKGQVFVSWASHCDYGGYMGWLISFDAHTLQPTAWWTPVPYSYEGGIWLSGSGPSLDENGNIYVAVANGAESDPGLVGSNGNYRSSLVKLNWSPSTGFSVIDYFAPFNYRWLDENDTDFGSGATLLLPAQNAAMHPHLAVVRDKKGLVYVLDRDELGNWRASGDTQAVQTFQASGNGLSSMLFWNSKLYIAGGRDVLKAYSFGPDTQQFDPIAQSAFNYWLDSRGSTPALSANGNSNAILWIITDYKDGKHAVLHALDPENLSNEFYNSAMVPERDSAGVGVKFTVPTIADGWVFVAAQNEVDMYGLIQ